MTRPHPLSGTLSTLFLALFFALWALVSHVTGQHFLVTSYLFLVTCGICFSSLLLYRIERRHSPHA